jgi:SRSO17 transposase
MLLFHNIFLLLLLEGLLQKEYPMLNFVVQSGRLFKSFVRHFHKVFSKKLFISFSVYLTSLMMEHKRVSIQALADKNLISSYEQLQYFLSDAKWDHQELNTHRLNLHQSHPATKSTKDGVLALDDTGCKKWGKKTEAAKVQHYGTEDRITNCNVVVASAFCSQVKRFPINQRPYLPQEAFYKPENRNFTFKTKHEIALDLIDDAVRKAILFSDITFDSWYFCDWFIQTIENRSLTWISKVQIDREVCFHGKWLRVGELVKLIPSTKFTRKVTVTNKKGEQRTYQLYAFKGKVKGLSDKKLIVLARGKWEDDDTEDTEVLVTNHLSLHAETVFLRWSLRWGIERIFQDTKGNLAFDQYQVRSIKAISRHWHMSFLAYSFLTWIRLNGTLSKIVKEVPQTIGETLQIFRDLNTFESWSFLKKNPKALTTKTRIKAKCYLKKVA